LEFAPQVALELADVLRVERLLIALVASPASLQTQSAPDPLYVDADHPGALSPASEGGHREPGEVAHLAVVALSDRPADRLPELVEIDPVARPFKALVLDPPLECLGLRRSEEVAVEEQLEDTAVLLRFRDRGCERLAEVALVGPAHLVQGGEGVEDLGGAHGDSL